MYYGFSGLGAELDLNTLFPKSVTADRPGSADSWNPASVWADSGTSAQDWGRVAQEGGAAVQEMMKKYSQVQLAKQAIKTQTARERAEAKLAAKQAEMEAMQRSRASSVGSPGTATWVIGGVVIALLVAVAAVGLKKRA